MNRFLELVLVQLMIWVIVLVIFVVFVAIQPLPHADYSSETRAFDVSKDLRCDFYIEYVGGSVVNVTMTPYCISLKK